MINLGDFLLTTQLLVVVSLDWNAVQAVLYRCQRNPFTFEWECLGSPIEVRLGKQGMAWGRGLADFSNQQGMCKKEGDDKTPAGIFYLGCAFGDLFHQSYVTRMLFLLITDDLEYVDDPDSIHYNQFVTCSTTNRDWKSSEKMKEMGSLYALGLVIQHNLNPIQKGMGSAIFMHVWKNPDSATRGCTSMAQSDLHEIVLWLDAKQLPCLVQLPLEEYNRKKSTWGLPSLI